MNITNLSLNARNINVILNAFTKVPGHWQRMFLRLPHLVTILSAEEFAHIDPPLGRTFTTNKCGGHVITGLCRREKHNQLFCLDVFERPTLFVNGEEVYILQLKFLQAVSALLLHKYPFIGKWLCASHKKFYKGYKTSDEFFVSIFPVYCLDLRCLGLYQGEECRLAMGLDSAMLQWSKTNKI